MRSGRGRVQRTGSHHLLVLMLVLLLLLLMLHLGPGLLLLRRRGIVVRNVVRKRISVVDRLDGSNLLVDLTEDIVVNRVLRGHRTEGTETVFVIIIVHFDARAHGRGNDLELARHDHGKGVGASRLIDSGNASPVTPFVDLPPKSVRLLLEETELAGGQETVATGSMNMSDRRVDNGRF